MSTDPTYVHMDNDPEQQRFSGVAVHGNTPFDVPYISRINDTLWQGGCKDGLVLPREVRHVVSLYPWEAYQARHDLDSALAVRMYDSLDGPDTTQLDALVRWVQQCRKTGVTLIHCQAGLNRSGLLAALVLIDDGMTPSEAIDLLRTQRSPAVLCNPTFEDIVMRRTDPQPTPNTHLHLDVGELAHAVERELRKRERQNGRPTLCCRETPHATTRPTTVAEPAPAAVPQERAPRMRTS